MVKKSVSCGLCGGGDGGGTTIGEDDRMGEVTKMSWAGGCAELPLPLTPIPIFPLSLDLIDDACCRPM